MKRIVIACGGTGGHFYPGYALAQALRPRGWETLFLLRSQDPARAELDKEDLPYVEIDLRGMPRGFSAEWPRFVWKVGASLRLTRNILRSYRPQCVAGMGGYLTFPAVFSAYLAGIPSILHESNAILGLANRACLPFVDRVALGLPLAQVPNRSKKQYELTGTPIRPGLLAPATAREAREAFGLAADAPTILIFGGSQGARGINRLAPEAMKLLAEKNPSIQCLHLSGAKEEDTVRAAYRDARFRHCVLAYTKEMRLAYAAADAVICRSGASTLAELAALSKPAILIPFPFAAANHQEANARVLERAGAAACLVEKNLSAAILAGTISDLVFSQKEGGSKLAAMSSAYRELDLPAAERAAQALADAVERTISAP